MFRECSLYMIWGKGARRFKQHPSNFCMIPLKPATNLMAPQKWQAKLWLPPSPSPHVGTTMIMIFFHTIMKETTSLPIATYRKPWFTQKTVPLKLIIKLQKRKLVIGVIDKIITILSVYTYGSEMGQNWLHLSCENLQFHERNNIIHAFFVYLLFFCWVGK